MLFSSITFLYYFLPITIIAYFLTPIACRNVTLLIASLIFYGWGEPRILFYMLFTIGINYILGRLMEQKADYKKLWLLFSVLFCLISLGYFKYADFFIENVNRVTGLAIPLLKVGLPIGISFYTFQIMSYTIDVYRGEVKAQRSVIKLATYISMFPQLIAGPIVRYQSVEAQLDNREYNADRIAEGIRRFVYGLSKKVLIANTLGELCVAFRGAEEASILFFWMYAVAFALQIYFDFSGYSDMAIGLGKILGFDFMENFNYPFISKSVTEFWRRWHISLGSWFRDYVYIPLGGSKGYSSRTYINILIVWVLTGFWHGASWNFVLWGIYFAILLLMEKSFLLKVLDGRVVASHIYVLVATLISFVIFNGENLGQIAMDLGSMFGIGSLPLVSSQTIYYLKNYLLVFIVAIVGATPLAKCIAKKYDKIKIIEPLVLLGLMIVVTAYLIDGSFNPFLYFRF